MMNRPMRTVNDSKSIDESTDTYDTIDWLIQNVPRNNGRVGILGVSYDGWLSAVATIDACPSIRCTPQCYSRVKRAITVPTTEERSREMKIGS